MRVWSVMKERLKRLRKDETLIEKELKIIDKWKSVLMNYYLFLKSFQQSIISTRIIYRKTISLNLNIKNFLIDLMSTIDRNRVAIDSSQIASSTSDTNLSNDDLMNRSEIKYFDIWIILSISTIILSIYWQFLLINIYLKEMIHIAKNNIMCAFLFSNFKSIKQAQNQLVILYFLSLFLALLY